MSIPPGFDELHESVDLFYRIEPDGSVLLTGEKTQVILSYTLKDGSKISGGISRKGDLFGDRVTLEQGQVKKYPLHWRDASRVPSPFKPRQPGTGFDPHELQQRPPPMPAPAPKRNETAFDTEALEEAKNALRKKIETPPKKKIFGGGKQLNDFELLEEAANAIESTLEQIQQVRKENALVADVQIEMTRLRAENEGLRNEVTRISETAKEAVKAARAEGERKAKVRRWQIEEMHGRELSTEGLDSKILEVEDAAGALKYIVVSTCARGTSASVLSQWQIDLKAKLDVLGFGARAIFVHAPDEARLSVLELVPGVAESVETSAQL